MPKAHCECGAEAQCYCMVVDDSQQVNEFTRKCNSGHVKKECKHVDEKCPFCGLSAEDHQETPMALWSYN